MLTRVLEKGICLVGEGGNARKSRNDSLVGVDAAQEHLLVEELVVVVQ